MKITKTICDYCSKEIEDANIIRIGIKDMQGHDIHSDLAEADFCENCAEAIYRFIIEEAAGSDKKPKVEPVQQKKPKANRGTKKEETQKKIDSGKVLALHKAGWAIKDIAADMYYSIDTVKSIITAEQLREKAVAVGEK